MKISCKIIKDLLPLYHDDVCSDESKMMIEEHLVYCESCKTELQAMDNKLLVRNTERNLNEAEAVKRLSRRWERGMNKSLLKGILITLGIIALIVLVLYGLMDIRFIPKT